MMKTLGLGMALLVLVAGCGTEAPPADDQTLANAQNVADNSMILDPGIPNAAETNVAAPDGPSPEPVGEPAESKIAPVPPPAPKAPPKAEADAPKAKADAPKAAPKAAAPTPGPSGPAKAECLPEHRAAGHC